MIEGSLCGGLTATARTSASHRPKIFLLYTPLDLRAIIGGNPVVAERRAADLRHYFPTKFRTVAHRSPPDVRPASRRAPADERIAPDIGR